MGILSVRLKFRTGIEYRRSRGPLQIHPKTLQNGAPGRGAGFPHRRPLAVPCLRAGPVAAVWLMLKAPLVPLTRKEGFRCSRARDISMEVWRPKNERKERRFGSFDTTKPDARGERQRRAIMVGSREEYPTESAARKSPEVQAILLRLNADQPSTADAANFGAVIARYEQEEMPERYSTSAAYQSYIKQPHPAALGRYAVDRRQADGGRRLAEELDSGPKDQEPCPKSDAHDFSVCGEVGTDRQEPDQAGSGQGWDQAPQNASGPRA